MKILKQMFECQEISMEDTLGDGNMEMLLVIESFILRPFFQLFCLYISSLMDLTFRQDAGIVI